jgi:GMP synthase (glutamine-hydrolysing)
VRRVLILKTGDTLAPIRARRGDFEDWIAAGMGLARAQVDVVDARRGGPLPDPAASAGIVVTGSSALVTDREAWSEAAAGWLREVVDAGTPLLGICYGHQLLAHALGGVVGDNPRGREIGTVALALQPEAARDPLLQVLSEGEPVHATHLQSVLALPAGARRLAATPGDPHQAFAVSDRAWGVQFHPEFDADVIRGYLAGRREQIAAEGLDAVALDNAVREAPAGPRLLRRFAALVRETRAGQGPDPSRRRA